ncbi:MAG: DUF4466 family protein [Dysgonamonadaceae bacterium]|nr:DUF4466 family protein [Dysgonamonadaceae bacterium]
MCLVPFLLFTSCENEESTPAFQNKCIKRSLGPNVAGQEIEFVYAVAIQPGAGRLVSAQVEASIAGAPATYLEHRSYHTAVNGIETAVVVGNPCVNSGNITQVEFTADTCAAALRYFYAIPEEAKGKNLKFIFSAVASNGERVSMEMGEYRIAEMDIKLDLAVSASQCYISLEDMAVYTAAQAAAVPGKIDLVYLYRNYNVDTVVFNHAFVAPATGVVKYLPGVTLPSGVNRDTKIRNTGIKDAHLARLHQKGEAQPAIYIDDIDLREMDMSRMPNYALDIITNDGMWLETQDGIYKAYIFANNMNRGRAGGTISIKRLKIK